MNNLIIYKYVPLDAYTISNLISETIYFNNVSNFDDPADAAFIILTAGEAISRENISSVKVQKLYDFMGVKYLREAQEQEFSLTLMQVGDQLEKALKKYIGISCFSKHDICPTCLFPQINPLMLTHYSSRHTGIVIEYLCDKREILKKVNYSPEYKHFNYANILNNLIPQDYPKRLEINDHVICPLLFKFEEWFYQKEYRIFSNPNQSLSYTELGLKIKRIFFGSRVEKHISDVIAKILTDKNINFYYLRSPINNNDQQRVIICDSWIRATGRNCHIKCELPKL